MLTVKIVPTGEEIKAESGILPAGRLLDRFDFRSLDALDRSPTKKVEYSSGDVFKSYAGMLCLGFRDFCDLERFREGRLFKAALGVGKVASESALRDRIDLHPEAAGELRRLNTDAVWDVLKPSASALGVVGEVVFADLDVSVHDNSGAKKREGVGPTYKNVAGFSPAYLYAGNEGYMLDSELRPGEQHCQKGTPELIRRAMDGAGRRGKKLLFRMDSGNDALENIRLIRRKHFYIIACNPRGMDLSEKAEEAESFGELVEETEEKEVYLWKEAVYHDDGRGGLFRAFRVVRLERRLQDENRQPLLVPLDEVSMWWTNLGLPPPEIVALYNDHGTSEQYHSEMKTDLDMERLPAISFASNKVAHAAAMVAFNVLRKMAVDAAKIMRRKGDPMRLRIKTVILDIMRAAGKFVFSGNRFTLKMNFADIAYPVVEKLYLAYG